jgi:hypothetical protein
MPKVLVLRDTLIALACSLPAAHADTIPFQTHRLKFAILLLGYGEPARFTQEHTTSRARHVIPRRK